MLKILQARLQQYMNNELLDVQAGFRKVRGVGEGTKQKVGRDAREFPGGLLRLDPAFAYAEPPPS